MSNQEPQVIEQINQGYVQTITSGDVTLKPTLQGNLAVIATEIDSTIYAYQTLTASYYMNTFYRSNYGENPQLFVPVGQHFNVEQMATYGELWKLNFKLMELFRQYYRQLDNTSTVRVYNNEPIIISTCSNAGYVVIHPTIQTDLVTGTDEYGDYYEANMGGTDNTGGTIGGNYLYANRGLRLLR